MTWGWGLLKVNKWKKTAAAVFFVSGVCLSATGAVAQDTQAQNIRLSPEAALGVARQALERGDLALAAGIADAFIARNPEDYRARILRALVAQRRGNLDVASENARAAYRAAINDAQRFESAWLVANVLGAQKRWERSKLWLRRADEAAPNEAAKRRVTEAYRVARRESPLSIQLSFAVRPTDNLNKGSDRDITTTQSAIRGTEASASASISYRIHANAKSRTELFFQNYTRLAFPEGDFETEVPGSDSRYFDFVVATVGVSHQRVLFENLGPTGIRLSYGGSYFRNEHLNSFANVGLSQVVRLNERESLRFGFDWRDETRIDARLSSTISRSVSADWTRRLGGAASMSFGAAYTAYNSGSTVREGKQLEFRASRTWDAKLLGATPDARLSYALRYLPIFDDNPFDGLPAAGRVDRVTRLTLGLTFNDYSWYGFVPRVEIQRAAQNSTLEEWSWSDNSIGVTLVSRF